MIIKQIGLENSETGELAYQVEIDGDVITETTWVDGEPIVTTRQATQEEIDNSNIIDQEENKTIPMSAINQLYSDLEDPTINSISEIKTVLKNFLDSIS